MLCGRHVCTVRRTAVRRTPQRNVYEGTLRTSHTRPPTRGRQCTVRWRIQAGEGVTETCMEMYRQMGAKLAPEHVMVDASGRLSSPGGCGGR
jgi:hypothetical protein